MVICDVPAGRASGVWMDDGTIIFGTSRSGLMRVPLTGGGPELITELDAGAGELGHTRPALLPNSDALLFTAWKGALEQSDTHVLNLEDGSRTLIVDGLAARYVRSGHLLYQSAGALWAVPFSPTDVQRGRNPIRVVDRVLTAIAGAAQYDVSAEGTLVYAVDQRTSDTRLAWVNRTGVVTRRSDVYRDVLNPSLAPRGTHIAFTSGITGDPATFSASILDVNRGVPSRIENAGAGASWSPTGEQFVYTSRFGAEAAPNLFLRSLASTDVTQLTFGEHEHFKIPSGWSQDGRFLAFVESIIGEADSDIWVLPMTNDAEPWQFAGSEFDETQPVISPDGRFLAYRSDSSGQDEVWVASFPDGILVQQASVAGGHEPRWSVDGTELFYRTGAHMMAVPVLDGAQLRLGEPEVLFADNFRMIVSLNNAGYDVTPDGQFLMVEERRAGPEQAEVVFNLPEELATLVPID